MKKILSLLICLLFVGSISAQKSKQEIPATAKTAFAAKFPTAQKAKWSIEKPGEYEVEFTLDKMESSALFDAAGTLIETETEINQSELPSAAKTTLAKDFAGFKLDEIERSTDAKGIISYEMEAVKGKEKLELCFDANGKLTSKEPLKKDKD